MRYLALLALAGCSSPRPPSPLPVARSPVAVLTPIANDQIDVLFMVDDSAGSLEGQSRLADAMPALVDRLNHRAAGLASLHVGVVTSDLGTSATTGAPAPSIPGCHGEGTNGVLQGNELVVDAPYLRDEPTADGLRITNYSGDLASALTALVEVPATGCGYEQHLEAVRRALQNDTDNHGFLRAAASLAVVFVSDQDDCSVADINLFNPLTTAELGPPAAFRCTRFGVICDDGGTTPYNMSLPGMKASCHSNPSPKLLARVADYQAFLAGLKPDPLMVMVGAIVGSPQPVNVDLVPQPNDPTPVSHLVHSCQYTRASDTIAADPAVRDVELAKMFDRRVVDTICQDDFTGPLTDIARQIDSMTGSPCLFRNIPSPADCVARDDDGDIDACTSDGETDCFELVTDATTCPDGQHLRVNYRGTPENKLTLFCRLP
jgi:hypothetical protein